MAATIDVLAVCGNAAGWLVVAAGAGGIDLLMPATSPEHVFVELMRGRLLLRWKHFYFALVAIVGGGDLVAGEVG